MKADNLDLCAGWLIITGVMIPAYVIISIAEMPLLVLGLITLNMIGCFAVIGVCVLETYREYKRTKSKPTIEKEVAGE